MTHHREHGYPPARSTPATTGSRIAQLLPVALYLSAAAFMVAHLNGWLVRSEGPRIEIERAVAVEGTDATSVYLTMRASKDGDEIVGATSSAANSVVVHGTDDQGVMTMAGHLEIPGGGELTMRPGRDHLMLTGLHRPLTPGTVVDVRVTFRRSPPLDVEARVVAYAEVPDLFPLLGAAPR